MKRFTGVHLKAVDIFIRRDFASTPAVRSSLVHPHEGLEEFKWALSLLLEDVETLWDRKLLARKEGSHDGKKIIFLNFNLMLPAGKYSLMEDSRASCRLKNCCC